METTRYIAASLACGLVAVFASENLFWSAPREEPSAVGFLLGWLVYAFGCACALSAVSWSGLGGARGLFLGGAVLGWVVEGVVVDTTYDAFPLQLVWTPLAWHALLTALLVFGSGRVAGARGVFMTLGAGATCGLFALWWPIERGAMPPFVEVAAYLAIGGLTLPIGHAILNRVGTVPRPRVAVLAVAPAIAALVWIVKGVLAPSPAKLALPIVLGLTLWTMRRLGGDAPVTFGDPPGPARLALTMAIPLLTLAVATAGWAAFPAGVPVNVPLALTTGAIGLGLWCHASWRAWARPRGG